jgi:DNA-binding NtrC family response regulator
VQFATAEPGTAAALLDPAEPLRSPAQWIDEPLETVRRKALESVERAYLDALLRATNGRIAETARRAGIQPRSLFEKLRRYGLEKKHYRPSRVT